MDRIVAELGPFFRDGAAEEKSLTNDELQVIQAYQEEAEKDQSVLDDELCAFISYKGKCGFANGGRKVYVVNRMTDKQVRVTVEVKWRQGTDSGEFERTRKLSAGSRIKLGCTRGDGRPPIPGYSFSVVGCEVLS